VVVGRCPRPAFRTRTIEKGLAVIAMVFAASWLYKMIATAFGG
jgi:hypothetical protein